MKLSEVLLEIGRPIAYYPKLRPVTGSTNATIFFCQFMYWAGKGSDPDGWIYKTSDEITDETGLSYEEQKTARKHLKEKFLMEEKYHRIEHQMYFRPNLKQLDEVWAAHSGTSPIPQRGNATMPPENDEASSQSLDGEQGVPVVPNVAPPGSLIESETTHKTTARAKPSTAGLSIENQIFVGAETITPFTPELIKQAVADHLKLNIRWNQKRPAKWRTMDDFFIPADFLDFAKQQNITPGEIELAVTICEADRKTFWRHPSLMCLYESWPLIKSRMVKLSTEVDTSEYRYT